MAVWNGLDDTRRDELNRVLRGLVPDPVPPNAISISDELPRYRLQVKDLTIGYEVDDPQAVVVVKVILPDTGPGADDERMLALMETIGGL